MNNAPCDILAMMSDPAVLINGSKFLYANSAAQEILGKDCLDRSASALLGAELTEARSPSFVTEITVNGISYSARVSAVENARAVILKRAEPAPPLVNDAFLCSARDDLMTLSCALELMRDKAEQKGLKDFLPDLAAMTRSNFRLSRLVSNLGLAQRIIDGSLRAQLTVTDLSSMIKDLVSAVEHCYQGIAFSILCPEQCLLALDPALVGKMLQHLLSNCIHHAEGCSHVIIRLSELPESVLISVTDNGCGIPSEELAGIFTCYDKRPPLHSLHKGAGLGLTIVCGIARAHGGTLMLESREDMGTTVRVSLSKRLRPADMIPEAAEPYSPDWINLREELSDCLPAECYGPEYLD